MRWRCSGRIPAGSRIVKPVDPDDPAVADVIADWKKTPGAVGIRIMLTKEAKRAPDDPGLDRILRAAVRHDFPVNILCWGNLDAGTALIDRHPDTRFIIDHLGILQPRTPPAPPQPWADLPKVLELAKRPNAVIKVSGACTLSREPYPFPDIWDPLARVFDAWGFERCLWGTDWTRAFAVVNYEQAVEPFLQDRPPERQRAGHADGRRLRQGLWLVAEEGLEPIEGPRHCERSEAISRRLRMTRGGDCFVALRAPRNDARDRHSDPARPACVTTLPQRTISDLT